MAEWSVRLEIEHSAPEVIEEQIDTIVDALERYAGVVSYNVRVISARLFIIAPTPLRAFGAGLQIFMAVLRKTGVRPTHISDVEVQAWSDLERRLDMPNVPELVGVAEVAQLLHVSKQRASEVARSKVFPRPIAELASGPIWKKVAILRHATQWSRKPGRPAKQLAHA